MVEDLNAQGVEHVLCTGDVTNLALEQEFEFARGEFDKLAHGPRGRHRDPRQPRRVRRRGHRRTSRKIFDDVSPHRRRLGVDRRDDGDDDDLRWPIVRDPRRARADRRDDLARDARGSPRTAASATASSRGCGTALVGSAARAARSASSRSTTRPPAGARESRIRGLRDHAAFAEVIAAARRGSDRPRPRAPRHDRDARRARTAPVAGSRDRVRHLRARQARSGPRATGSSRSTRARSPAITCVCGVVATASSRQSPGALSNLTMELDNGLEREIPRATDDDRRALPTPTAIEAADQKYVMRPWPHPAGEPVIVAKATRLHDHRHPRQGVPRPHGRVLRQQRRSLPPADHRSRDQADGRGAAGLAASTARSPVVKLAKRLSSSAPKSLNKVFFSTGGSRGERVRAQARAPVRRRSPTSRTSRTAITA